LCRQRWPARRSRQPEPLGLTVTKAASVLGVSRQALNNVVNARAAISPEMAVRLAKAFGSTAETWLRMQMAYDLAEVIRREHRIKVERYWPRKRSAA